MSREPLIDREHIDNLKRELSLASCYQDREPVFYAPEPPTRIGISVRTEGRDYSARICESCARQFFPSTGNQTYCSLDKCQSRRLNGATARRVGAWRDKPHQWEAYSTTNRKCKKCYLSLKKGPHGPESIATAGRRLGLSDVAPEDQQRAYDAETD
jgi:hypothetical protein